MSDHCSCGRWPVHVTIPAALTWILWEDGVSWHGNGFSLTVLYAICTACPQTHIQSPCWNDIWMNNSTLVPSVILLCVGYQGRKAHPSQLHSVESGTAAAQEDLLHSANTHQSGLKTPWLCWLALLLLLVCLLSSWPSPRSSLWAWGDWRDSATFTDLYVAIPC